MNQKVTIDEWLTSKLTYQLLSALSFLHTSRIIHRDIKAENIMLSSNMDLHLSDFGVSVFWEGDEKFDEITGTIGYMAPEMLLISLKPDDKSLKYHKE
ncbi:MAG: Phosphorylase b kinase gamma catalytic chain, liver/testis isoform, partial [Marteilia pararefringens]